MTRKDTIVENNEVMTFLASTENVLDALQNNTYSLTVLDDDGKKL